MESGSRERARRLRRWQQGFPDATAIVDLVPRQRGVVVGVVHKIRLVPARAIEVTLEDGSGLLVASWTGRTSLPGVQLGAGLRVEGTPARERHGPPRMRNPDYGLVAEPEPR